MKLLALVDSMIVYVETQPDMWEILLRLHDMRREICGTEGTASVVNHTNEEGSTMAAWNTGTESSLVSREDAKAEILEMARDQGIAGAFKVFYRDEMVTNPDALPAEVDMDSVRVSAVLDQAV